MTDFDYHLKVLLLGDPSTGKEELFKKYISGTFQEDYKFTFGVNYYKVTLNFRRKRVRLQLWDWGGEERFKFLLSQYCKGANGAVIMCDITNSGTLNHLDEWVQIIRNNAGDIPIFLVGNKLHLEKSREISKEEGIEIAKKYNLSTYIEISTETGQNVENTFEIIMETLNQKYIGIS